MAIETRFAELAGDLQALGEALDGLRVALVEDRPRQGAPLLLDQLGDATLDLLGWLQEAAAAAAAGRREAERPRDLEAAQGALLAAQERVQRIAVRFAEDLLNCRRVTEIGALGRERGREWRRFSDSVERSLDDCQQRLLRVGQALFNCWDDLTGLSVPGAAAPAATRRTSRPDPGPQSGGGTVPGRRPV
jgi:hypothetical protein